MNSSLKYTCVILRRKWDTFGGFKFQNTLLILILEVVGII